MVYDPANKPQNPYAAAYANFVEQTKDHVLTVSVDDGLNRQMRVGEPGSGIWSWRVITWPGYLATFGDVADGFMFTREADMLRFFDRREHDAYYSDGAPSIDFRYWAEKLAGSNEVRNYSSKLFIQYVTEQLLEHDEMGSEPQEEYDNIVEATRRVCTHNGVDYDEYLVEIRQRGDSRHSLLDVDPDDELQVEYYGLEIPEQSPSERRAAIIAEARRHESEHEAREWLGEHQNVFGEDYYEVSLRDFNVHFLYTCYAIDLTVKLWREYEKTPEAAVRRNPGDSYVWVEGGLVQNNPALPVFDLDVLESDFPNAESAEEALDLYERLVQHPKAALDMAHGLSAVVDFVRAYGSRESVQAIEAHEAGRSGVSASAALHTPSGV